MCEERTVLISVSRSLKCREGSKTSDNNNVVIYEHTKSFQISFNVTQL